MKPDEMKLSMEEITGILRRLESCSLNKEDYEKIKVLIETFIYMRLLLQSKTTSLIKLLKRIFGFKTEKANNILDKPKKSAPPSEKKPVKGHGRNGSADYAGAKKETIPHESLKSGDACPLCPKGKVYELEPKRIIRMEGAAPIQATIYECQRLRCNLCGEVFTATAPEGIGQDKYDETAGSMIAVLRYGSGLPFNRIENLQKSVDMPLPASTQWEIVRDIAKKISPAYEELVKQAAQGEIIHNDDTTMRILDSVNPDTDRKGVFTTGILSIKEEKKIALFKTGSNHAGENITALLRQRSSALPPPIQMCDGLSRNISKEFETLVANCMAHGRRNFVDLHSIFPEECRYVIEVIANIYKNDDDTKNMSPEERLAFHQVHSGPLMNDLRLWLNEQMDTKKVEPNSSLGKAFSYMLRRWERLTLFLRVPNAPLDNNICEQALKMAIRHRKNSLFYKTQNGAMVGDTFMSLIHTCNLCGTNPFDYLNALQRYASELAANPELWMPWNYKDTIRTLAE